MNVSEPSRVGDTFTEIGRGHSEEPFDIENLAQIRNRNAEIPKRGNNG